MFRGHARRGEPQQHGKRGAAARPEAAEDPELRQAMERARQERLAAGGSAFAAAIAAGEAREGVLRERAAAAALAQPAADPGEESASAAAEEPRPAAPAQRGANCRGAGRRGQALRPRWRPGALAAFEGRGNAEEEGGREPATALPRQAQSGKKRPAHAMWDAEVADSAGHPRRRTRLRKKTPNGPRRCPGRAASEPCIFSTDFPGEAAEVGPNAKQCVMCSAHGTRGLLRQRSLRQGAALVATFWGFDEDIARAAAGRLRGGGRDRFCPGTEETRCVFNPKFPGGPMVLDIRKNPGGLCTFCCPGRLDVADATGRRRKQAVTHALKELRAKNMDIFARALRRLPPDLREAFLRSARLRQPRRAEPNPGGGALGGPVERPREPAEFDMDCGSEAPPAPPAVARACPGPPGGGACIFSLDDPMGPAALEDGSDFCVFCLGAGALQQACAQSQISTLAAKLGALRACSADAFRQAIAMLPPQAGRRQLCRGLAEQPCQYNLRDAGAPALLLHCDQPDARC